MKCLFGAIISAVCLGALCSPTPPRFADNSQSSDDMPRDGREMLIFTSGNYIPDYLLRDSYEIYPVTSERQSIGAGEGIAVKALMDPNSGLADRNIQSYGPNVIRRDDVGIPLSVFPQPRPLVPQARIVPLSRPILVRPLESSTRDPALSQGISSGPILVNPRVDNVYGPASATSYSILNSEQLENVQQQRTSQMETVPASSNSLRRVDNQETDYGNAVPSPYSFGYVIDDGAGSRNHRQETSRGDGAVVGSYGYADYQGVYRLVNYIADKDGYRVSMKTNEPGTSSTGSADVVVVAEPPPSAALVEANRYLVRQRIANGEIARPL